MAKGKRSRPRPKIRASNRPSRNAELERIEDLLGEEFESLSEARRALKAETGAVPGKDRYTVRELSSRNNRTVKSQIADFEAHSNTIDALKKPEEYWAAEIYGHGTYQLYASVEQLARKLATYRGLQEENPKKALKNIKIIRVSGRNAIAEYQRQKRLEVEDSLRLRKLKGKRDRAREKAMQQKIKTLESQVKKLRRKLKK